MKRRFKFSGEEEIILLREVAACKDHIERTGETSGYFEVATVKLNGMKKMKSRVAWKALQDRYKSLQSRYKDDDRTYRKMRAIGGEVSEIEEILALMKEDRDDQLATHKAKMEMDEKREK